ncbi:MAG: rhodanese-like domain-containing protein [Planctomycetes bacterium]|nr:rhodanese-like domain-containing protein [Planctomycetota bacterium]
MTNKPTIIFGMLIISIFLLFANCSNEGNTGDVEIPDTTTETPSTNTEIPETEEPLTPATTELPPSDYLPEVPRISIHEVKAKLDAGANILIVDSRHDHSYDESHIAGAISIPLDNMSEPYDGFESYDEIITYCT